MIVEQEPDEKARLLGSGAVATDLAVTLEPCLNGVPSFFVDDAVVKTRVASVLMGYLSDIEGIGQDPVDVAA